ncbi:MAG: hypothetical protein EOP10_04875 [Proteobacteria bacterium]|nr:MAG: hypothetical protein EOP10_04875 [Pseudomonadota bacterium]
MKVFAPIALVLTASLFVGCAHETSATQDSDRTSTAAASEDKTGESTTAPSARDGWNDVKAGTKEATAGAGEIASDAGHSVVEGTKEVGRDIKAGAKEVANDTKALACPVLGNKTNKVYYTKKSKSYEALLNGKKALAYENRECFTSEANAREAGFKSFTK